MGNSEVSQNEVELGDPCHRLGLAGWFWKAFTVAWLCSGFDGITWVAR
jgi:hypothetical protein